MAKTVITPEQKEFQKLKRFVDKRFPGARTEAFESAGSMYYRVVSGAGFAIVDPELMIPPAKTVRQAWIDAKYCAWFSNMIRKSNAAFNEEKIYKKLAKEAGE